MLIAAAVFAVLAFVLFDRWRTRRATAAAPEKDSTPAVDAWLAGALEDELADLVLGVRGASAEERRPLARTLRGEPDPEIVGKIEDAVKSVELEYVCYAHETDVEATVRVHYESGKTGSASRRLPLGDVPDTVRADFQQKGATRSFRGWTFPWQRAAAL